MIRSMTGFGEAAAETPAGRLRVEIRTVNHRYFSTNLRLARGLERFEPQVRDWLRAWLPRGHVHCSIALDRPDTVNGGGVQVDESRARQYVEALRRLKEALGLDGDVDLALLTRFSDVLAWDETTEVTPEPDAIRAVIDEAARAAVAMREQEGLRLAADLDERLAAIDVALAVIGERAPARLVVERDRMRRVIAELLDNVSFDEERIAREIAVIAERWDVSEEIVRMRSHLELFREALASDSEPIGKRLGFLIQEMNREANTIGSKANDAPIEHQVIAIKEEIERLREQVENIE
jgi:uncharacterized protein (TIGR00255 family)